MRMDGKNQECEVLNNVTMKPECALNSVNTIDYLKAYDISAGGSS